MGIEEPDGNSGPQVPSRRASILTGGFIAAAALAPASTAVLAFLLGALAERDGPTETGLFWLPAIVGALAGLGLAFGWFGSAVLLGASFAVAAVVRPLRPGWTHRAIAYGAAGGFAGTAHVAIALSNDGAPWGGVRALMGAWFIRSMFERQELVALAPPIAGVLAGLLFAAMTGDRLSGRSCGAREEASD